MLMAALMAALIAAFIAASDFRDPSESVFLWDSMVVN